MEYTTLGKTGLEVSVAGLGCGGFSKIGRGTGRTVSESVNIVRQALDAGINFIDTASSYETETIVGEAIKERDRGEIIISTKTQIKDGAELISPKNPEHLKVNIESILSGPLPEKDLQQIKDLFGHLEGVGLVAPGK